MDALSSLLGTSLIVLAHPDDECVTYGALLQRMADPTVVFLTDGAPHDPYFWERYGSREAYASWRQQEARRALAHVGVRQVRFAAANNGAAASQVLVDQELFRKLPEGWRELSNVIERLRPQALLTLAYEGGHPDHDSCNLLVALAARRFGLPAWEAPIYSRACSSESDHNPHPQRFIRKNGTEIDVVPTPAEVERKRDMWEAYSSQGDFLRIFSLELETVRPLPVYDYSQPPHPGKLNYEHWQWSMTSREVCAAFSEFLKEFQQHA